MPPRRRLKAVESDAEPEATKPQITMQMMVIEPEKAAEWMGRNTHNRPLSGVHSGDIASVMERGEWIPTHQGIAFDENLVLIDGQHRLAAIVESGIPTEMAVFWGVPAKAFEVIDTHRRRSASDVLAIDGHVSTSQLSGAASMLELYNLWIAGRTRATRIKKLSNSQVKSIVDAHAGLPSAVRMAGPALKALKIAPSAAIVAAYLLIKRNEEDAAEFFALLRSGAEMSEHHPILRLRERFITAKARIRSDMETIEQLALIIKAWNFWREGRDVMVLVWRYRGDEGVEEMPVPA